MVFNNSSESGKNKYLPLTGGTMNGSITGLPTPTQSSEATNKSYVDTAVASAGGISQSDLDSAIANVTTTAGSGGWVNKKVLTGQTFTIGPCISFIGWVSHYGVMYPFTCDGTYIKWLSSSTPYNYSATMTRTGSSNAYYFKFRCSGNGDSTIGYLVAPVGYTVSS